MHLPRAVHHTDIRSNATTFLKDTCKVAQAANSFLKVKQAASSLLLSQLYNRISFFFQNHAYPTVLLISTANRRGNQKKITLN